MAKVVGTIFASDDLEEESDFVPLFPGESAPLQGAGLMTEIVLKEKTRLADQYLTLNIADGKVTEGKELTQQEYAALALKGAGAPPGVSKEDWESNKVCAAGGVRNYGAGQRSLNHGEYAELSDRFELAIVRKDLGSMKQTLEILKSKVSVSTATGLTITKVDQDAWPDGIGIVSIVNGILTTE